MRIQDNLDKFSLLEYLIIAKDFFVSMVYRFSAAGEYRTVQLAERLRIFSGSGTTGDLKTGFPATKGVTKDGHQRKSTETARRVAGKN